MIMRESEAYLMWKTVEQADRKSSTYRKYKQWLQDLLTDHHTTEWLLVSTKIYKVTARYAQCISLTNLVECLLASVTDSSDFINKKTLKVLSPLSPMVQ